MLREFPLPGRMSERLRPDGTPLHAAPPVRDAATVMLVRDGASGVEVFAFRRVPRMAFAAGMLVFPGGSVDPADGGEQMPWAGSRPVREEAGPLAAAVRETFEECGVLLATDADGKPPDAATLASPPWEEARQDLAAGRTGLAEVLAAANLAVRAVDLHPWARWITPPFENRRFDTRFYLASPPAGQEPRDLGGEGEHAAWLSTSAAVDAHRSGELPMLPPTLVCLEELAAAPDVATLLATPRTPRPVSPWIAATDDGALVLRIDLDGHGGGEPAP